MSFEVEIKKVGLCYTKCGKIVHPTHHHLQHILRPSDQLKSSLAQDPNLQSLIKWFLIVEQFF
jgi:hypothetical protein